MPDPALLTPLGRATLADIPPILRDDPDIQGVIHASARELEQVEEKIEELRTELFPQTATEVGMRIWEAQLQLPINEAAPLEDRRDVVMAHLAKLGGAPSGRDWVANVTKLIGPGWDYEEHVPLNERRIGNLITNPNAETGTAGYGVLNGALSNPGAGGAKLIRVTAAAAGAFGAHWPLNAPDRPAASPEKTYTALVPVAAVPAGRQVRTSIEWYRANDTLISVSAGAWRSTAGIALVTAEAPPETAKVVVTCYTDGGAAAEVLDLEGFMFAEGVHTTYVDGTVQFWEWTGAADASTTRRTSPPEYTLRIFLPFAPDTGQYAQVERLLRDITPAHLDLVLVSEAGFQFDHSQLDQEPFGY